MANDKETFNCKLIEVRDQSLHVEHLGRAVFLPRSQIERWHSSLPSVVTVTIPYWLYKAKFED